MNFLQICQRVHRLIGGGQELASTLSPTSTTSQVELPGEIVYWVNDAYEDCQREQKFWYWTRGRGTLPILSGVSTISLATAQVAIPTFDYLMPFIDGNGVDYLLVYDPVIGVGDETFCYAMDYENFRGWKDRGVLPTGKPQYYCIRPDKTIEFSPTPDKNYTLVCDYRLLTDVLSGDTDTPLMPPRFHEAIAYKAAMMWAIQRESPNKYEMFKREYEDVMTRMRIEQLPRVEMDASLYAGWNRY